MEHDSNNRSGYHEPEPGSAGLEESEDWGDDFPKTFSVNLIWAQARSKSGQQGAIGYKGGMPWHLSEDLKHFQELTVSHPVIMGRHTWESLSPKSRPLPNREAIPDDGLDRSEIWVIGGAELFREAMPIANKVYVTDIDAEVDADTYAPDIDALAERGEWSVTDRSARLTPKNADSGIEGYRFRTFERVR